MPNLLPNSDWVSMCCDGGVKPYLTRAFVSPVVSTLANLTPPVRKEILEQIASMLCLRRPTPVEQQDVLVHGELHEGDVMTFGARIQVRGVI